MPMNAASMLKANQTQTPNGTALNASQTLGLPGLGSNLQDDVEDELKKQKLNAQTGAGPVGSMLQSAASMLFPGMK